MPNEFAPFTLNAQFATLKYQQTVTITKNKKQYKKKNKKDNGMNSWLLYTHIVH